MTHAAPDGSDGHPVPPKLFLLQMAGESGAGKSSLAREIAATTGAAALDMDIMKSTALDAGADWELAGRMSHLGLRSLADSLLAQGFSVIFDQPCRFERTVTEGIASPDGTKRPTASSSAS